MRYAIRQQHKRRWPKRLLIVAAVAVALTLGATIAVRHVYFGNLKPVKNSEGAAFITLTIDRGATVEQIAQQLHQAGLIRSPWAFKLYVGSKNVRDALQAGTYSFSPSQDVAQIVAQLTHGKVATDLVTIVPGQRLEQIRASLVNYGFKEDEVARALEVSIYPGKSALVDIPRGASLEGYIYPDSYQRDGNTHPEDIIGKALDEMSAKLTPQLRQSFAAKGLTTYEAIILASVVEKEVSKPEDRTQVAQVFLSRLSSNIALESDATKPYFDSYNTPGLPPSPISNVTASSLAAVANPASTDWLYFVSGDDGATHFSKTLAEHQANVNRYCTKLCSQ